MEDQSRSDFSDLIPELSQWNNGRGIDPEIWIGSMGNYELAAGYSLIFWPKFVLFEGYVLRGGFSLKALRGFEKKGERSGVEAVMNHLHISDIHYHVEANESQLRYLGRVLKDIHQVKLRQDFPDIRFTVDFNDEDGLDQVEYELTFWQSAD
jgi:hypothetical protein